MRFFGRFLRKYRAGAAYRVGEDPRFSGVPRALVLRSPDFVDGEPLPAGTRSPALRWEQVPAHAQTLVLLVEDVDVPFPRPAVHAIAYALDPHTTGLDAGEINDDQTALGYNSLGQRKYLAPVPLPGHGRHHYVYTLFAVDYTPHFDQAPNRERLLDAIAGHVCGLAELTGTAER